MEGLGDIKDAIKRHALPFAYLKPKSRQYFFAFPAFKASIWQLL